MGVYKKEGFEHIVGPLGGFMSILLQRYKVYENMRLGLSHRLQEVCQYTGVGVSETGIDAVVGQILLPLDELSTTFTNFTVVGARIEQSVAKCRYERIAAATELMLGSAWMLFFAKNTKRFQALPNPSHYYGSFCQEGAQALTHLLDGESDQCGCGVIARLFPDMAVALTRFLAEKDLSAIDSLLQYGVVCNGGLDALTEAESDGFLVVNAGVTTIN